MIFNNTGYTKKYMLTHPHEMILNWCSDIKCAWQRANKGYCYRDLWSIDSWFMRIMPEMIREYKKNKHGYPSRFKSEEEWDKILDTIILHFREANAETTSFINKYDEGYYKKVLPIWIEQFKDSEKELSDTGYYTVQSIQDMNVLEEIKKLDENHYSEYRKKQEYMRINKEKALELFVKYFDDLWY